MMVETANPTAAGREVSQAQAQQQASEPVKKSKGPRVYEHWQGNEVRRVLGRSGKWGDGEMGWVMGRDMVMGSGVAGKCGGGVVG